MARDLEGSNGTAINTACPLHCRSKNGTDQVDWAGFPVNLDLAFSQNQREKVMAQYRRLRRGTLLRRQTRDVAQVCACEEADRSVSTT
ncbi:hypothetical protein [Mycobacterium asiaticum]|uniref:hypothetical protein n=1 Tax=Mycobacterium asiaticum TaxID=1790 RepID=UPI0005672E33|nr:hypothetical protein [Mycobacterium asiaticum]ORA08100.1 hypothetical protein BST16_27715 [Mycobacterium asiaticum DSM 44297]